MITISLCMIVKNEEQNLRRCLDSLHGLMDEIIIVDTGSTDKTKEIAREYTEKLYEFQWVDDFAKARNYCISKATKEYIYIADADEVLEEENHKRFELLKEALLPEIDVVQMKYGNQLAFNTVYNYDEEYRPKLFKRVREFYFIDPVHETLQVEPIVYDSDVVITHKPHDHHASRDFATFQKAILRGERIGKRILNMYAKELLIAGNDEEFAEAKPFFEQVLCEEGRSEQEILDAMIILAHCARIERDIIAFFKYTMKIMVMNPCSECCYELGEFYKEKQDHYEAIVWFYNAAYESEPAYSLLYHEEKAYKGLAACYEAVGDQEKAREYRNKRNK